MAARILQLDLSRPLGPFRVQRKRYSALWIVVRWGIRPIGWLRWRTNQLGDVLQPDMLQILLADQLGLQLVDLIRDPRLRQPPGAYQPTLSVVVCTREHPDQLQRQLESCSKLIYPNYEVIVVDNAPISSGTRRVCEKFPSVRYVIEPRKGLDYARNTGWQNARNEIVAYTDDDAVVDPHWLTALGSAYVDPRVECVTGTTFPMEVENDAQELFEKYGGMHKGFVRRVFSPGTWNPFYPLGSGRFGAGVNMSLRRQTLQRMGGFDEALDVGSLARGGGDLDIMARVIRDGGTLVYEPCAIAWHQHRRTMKQLRRQMFDYGYGFTAFAAKYARDLELGNFSAKMVRRWANIWGKKRFRKNLKLALHGKQHFPLHLILLEVLGGIMGARAYKRSVRHVQSRAYRARLDDAGRGGLAA